MEQEKGFSKSRSRSQPSGILLGDKMGQGGYWMNMNFDKCSGALGGGRELNRRKPVHNHHSV